MRQPLTNFVSSSVNVWRMCTTRGLVEGILSQSYLTIRRDDERRNSY